MNGDNWTDSAACLGLPTEIFFPKNGGNYRRARRFCSGCPVAEECLDYALEREDGESIATRSGMFGGHTPEERVTIAQVRAELGVAS